MKTIGSLIFCVLAVAVFLWVATASRQKLPVGLVELYGDISGIRALTIEGDVASSWTWEGRYGYSFTISPERQFTRMYVFNNSRAFSEFFWRSHSFHHEFQTRWRLPSLHLTYSPIDGARPVASYSTSSFFIDNAGNVVPQPEYRTYSEVFEVVPRINNSQHPITTRRNQLFIYAGADAYLVQHSHTSGSFDRHLVSPNLPASASGLRLFDVENIGDKYLAVPTGPGLFGITAVYAIHRPFNSTNTSALFPITLERGKDEIIGLLGLTESVLLLISRAGGLEITRINPTTEENLTIFLPTDARFHQHFLCENFLVLHGSTGTNENIIATFDLQNDDLNLMSVFPVLYQYQQLYVFSSIWDIIVNNDAIYVAYTITKESREHFTNTQKIFISEFDSNGQLIGQAQVLTGVEDDSFLLWQPHGGIRPQYQRNLQSLNLRRP